MTTTQERETIYVGVDIEKAGNMMMKHPVISVGFAVCKNDAKYTVLAKRRFNFAVNWPSESGMGDFEPRCWTEFWSKLPAEVIHACKVDVLEQEDGWKQVAAWLDALEVEYPADKYRITFVNDNPAFDIGNIDYFLEKYTGRHPMRYTRDGGYRSVTVVDDVLYMIHPDIRDDIQNYAKSIISHDHNPENDAHYMCIVLFELIKARTATFVEDDKWYAKDE